MKSILAGLVAFFAIATQAEAAGLLCHSRAQDNVRFMEITVEAGYASATSLSDVKVTTVEKDYNDEVATQTGRTKRLEKNPNYKPRKYKNHSHFNLSQLTNTNDFDKFLPSDSCELNLLLPDAVGMVDSFTAPMIIHCDQSGGSITLDCKTIR